MIGLSRLPYGWSAEQHPALRDRLVTRWWHKRRYWRLQWQESRSPWHWYYTSGAQCVHDHEGSWTSDTGNGYYGGYQYDLGTWIAAGGTRYAARADEATPLEQIMITRAKVQREGWGAWPNTARMCGLL
jgi:hypothetical protein